MMIPDDNFTSESRVDAEEAAQGAGRAAVPVLRPPAGQDRVHVAGARREGSWPHREKKDKYFHEALSTAQCSASRILLHCLGVA